MANGIDLNPSLEKIGRAERKLGHIETMLNAWVSNGIRYGVRRERHGQRFHIIARIEDLPPDEISWEVVEAVGHLRSALDKMLVALVEANGRGVSGVGFPFGGLSKEGQPEPFPSARHDALKKKLTPEQWELVLAQQPHPAGNQLLWAVNEIANEDKHRKDLVRVAAAIRATSMHITGGIFIGDGTGSGISLGGDRDFICPDQERESVLLSYAFGPGSAHPQIDQAVSISVVFGPIKPIAGKEVFSTLGQQVRLTKGIVESFAAAFA